MTMGVATPLIMRFKRFSVMINPPYFVVETAISIIIAYLSEKVNMVGLCALNGNKKEQAYAC